jgi:hypothetical protein
LFFLLIPFFPSQAGIICPISKMDDSVHLKNCEKGKFKVAKFLNRTSKLVHQMWDEMVSMIVIKKDDKIVTTFEATQIDVDNSYMIKAPKKKKKEVTIDEKKEKTIDNLIMKKYLKNLDEIECKHVNESIKSEFLDASSLEIMETSLFKG